MPTNRIENRQFAFTVEGETEQWYFEWLAKQINACPQSLYNVKIIAKVQQSPQKYAKTVNPLATPLVTHICDYESNNHEHTENFKNILSQLRTANSTVGRKFKYELGYSNFTFELWMILHKTTCNGRLANRTKYLPLINSAFDENFISLDHYKQEKNFKRCLSKLSLEDVRKAIDRARKIMELKADEQATLLEHRGFSYYPDNPALTIWESVKRIMDECGL